MARKKKEDTTEVSVEVEIIPKGIEFLSVDYGREDLNNMSRKINEIISYLNGQR